MTIISASTENLLLTPDTTPVKSLALLTGSEFYRGSKGESQLIMYTKGLTRELDEAHYGLLENRHTFARCGGCFR